MSFITWDAFEKIDIRCSPIPEVTHFPQACQPACRLLIDFGNEPGIKKSSGQITRYYSIAGLINRQVVAVVSFPPKQIAGFFSECLVPGSYDENNHVILSQPERAAKKEAANRLTHA